MAKAASRALGTLAADDHIDDRAIDKLEQDRLGHRAIAERIAELVSLTRTPATIGLLGPWGSGKSSVLNLLQLVVAKSQGGYYFVRYDAWKFAEDPLRRHLLIEAATGLTGAANAQKLIRRLYSKRKWTNYSPTLPGIATAFLVGLLLLGFLLTGLLVAAFVIAAVVMLLTPNSDFATLAREYLTDAIPVLILSSVAFAPLAAVLVSRLREDSEEPEPSSAEQFDDLFRNLVKERTNNSKRLIFVIDELDRADDDRVVAMLQTLRTFLSVDNCVYVVAADPVVIESAMLRKSAPSNDADPVHTSGSSFLDKIFQYQVSIPAIQVERIYAFALSLVAKRGGVWQDLGSNVADVISILIPTHVTSARRVKVLLNSFAMTYRIVAVRADALGVDATTAAAEIAKLVCLRTEFPLAYRAFENYWPILAFLEAEALGDEDRMIAYRANPEIVAALAELDRSGVDVRRPGTGPEDQKRDRSRLADYLRRTRSVALPRPALVYLEARSVPIGLPPALGQTIDERARTGDVDAVVEALAASSPTERLAGLRYLISLVRDSTVLDREGLVRCSLALANSFDEASFGNALSDMRGLVSSPQVIDVLGPDEVSVLTRAAKREQKPASQFVAVLSTLASRSDDGLVAVLSLGNDQQPNVVAAASERLWALAAESMDRLLDVLKKSGGGAQAAYLRPFTVRLGTLLAASDGTGPVREVADLVVEAASPIQAWDVLRPLLEDGERPLLDECMPLVSLAPKPLDDPETTHALLSASVTAPENAATFTALIGTVTDTQADVLGPAIRAIIDHGLLTATNHEPARTVLSKIGSRMSDDPSLVGDLVDDLSDLTERPWGADTDAVQQRRLHELLFSLASAAHEGLRSLIEDPVYQSCRYLLESGSAVQEEARKCLRDAYFQLAQESTDTASLSSAVKSINAAPARGAFTESERRYLVMLLSERLAQLRASAPIDLAPIADAAFADDQELPVGLYIAASGTMPSQRPDLSPLAVRAAQQNKYTSGRLRDYYDRLSASEVAALIETLTNEGIEPPSVVAGWLRTAKNTNAAIEFLLEELTNASDNERRAFLLQYLAEFVRDVRADSKAGKVLLRTAGLNKGANRAVGAILSEVTPDKKFLERFETKRVKVGSSAFGTAVRRLLGAKRETTD